MRSIRQSDEDTPAKILNIARNVQDASRMVQRVANIIKNQKTVMRILVDLHHVRSASVPVRKRTSLPSGAPAEHLKVGKMLAEWRKIGENITQGRGRTEAQRSSPWQKICLEG